MLSHRATRGRRALPWALAVAFGLTFIYLVPANAVTPTLTASFTPSSAGAGAATPFVLSVSSNQGTLGSLSLQAPDGFYVDSATASSGTASVTPDHRTVSVNGLRISGSAVLAVSIAAFPRCTPGSPNTWNLSASQRNGGSNYVPQTFSTTVTTPSACQLLFDPIADQGSIPGTTTVTVRAARANGSTDTTYSDAISLTIATDPGNADATLTGGSPTNPTLGVATFTASLDVAGYGYVLEACSPTINGSSCPSVASPHFLSGAFAVYNNSTACHNNQNCSVTASGAQVSTQISVPGHLGRFVRAGVWGVPQAGPTGVSDLANLDCAGYDEITESAATFDYTGTDGKVIVDTISADVMKEIANQGVAHLEWCGASTLSFTDKFGQPAVLDPTLGMYVGLWPDCPTGGGDPMPFAPCVFARNGGGAGTGQIFAVAPPYDGGGARH
jgi:hypothetical protein